MAIAIIILASCKKESVQSNSNPEKTDMDLATLKQRISNNGSQLCPALLQSCELRHGLGMRIDKII